MAPRPLFSGVTAGLGIGIGSPNACCLKTGAMGFRQPAAASSCGAESRIASLALGALRLVATTFRPQRLRIDQSSSGGVAIVVATTMKTAAA